MTDTKTEVKRYALSVFFTYPPEATRMVERNDGAWIHFDDFDALRRELEIAKRVIALANNSLYGSHGFFLSSNGGPDDEHHLDRKIEELKTYGREEYIKRTAAEKERDQAHDSGLEAAALACERRADSVTSGSAIARQCAVDARSLKRGGK